jgi:hypothetical protein
MKEKELTAVEWLQSQIVFESVDKELLARWDEDSDLSEYFEQALQMEKEQIVNAHYQGYRPSIGTTEISEKYYNETFKQQEQ